MAFYASVEKRDDPSLRDNPLIIGGGTRGVVSTCCYIARQSGVRSAMPMFKARELCPDAAIIKPNMAQYVEVSRQIRRHMEALTPLVEPISIDEAFPTSRVPRRCTRRPLPLCWRGSRARWSGRFGVDHLGRSQPQQVSFSKLASDLDKPRGYAVIGAGRDPRLSRAEADQPHLRRGQGLHRDLAQGRLPDHRTVAAGGTGAADAAHMANGSPARPSGPGEDARRVSPEGEMKTISSETTFHSDIAGLENSQPSCCMSASGSPNGSRPRVWSATR